MSNFIKEIVPSILSEDPSVQHFAIGALKGTYLATPDMLFTALEASDKGTNPMPILPFIDFFPVDERGLEELINRCMVDVDVRNKIWYAKLINNASTDLLLAYKDPLKKVMNTKFLESLQEIKSYDVEGLFMELADIMHMLEDEYNNNLFNLGKRIIRELIDRDEIPQWEVENGIRNNLEEHEYMPIHGIYCIFMAAELRTESVLPELIQILNKDEGDYVLEEVKKALIRIGTDEVIHEVEKVALNEDTFYFSIDILAKIKRKNAEAALIRLYDQTNDVSIRTLIADALCQHLSIESIPRIQSLIENGYDSQMLDLTESLYANLRINQIPHPKLQEMKSNLEEKERQMNERRTEMNNLFKLVQEKDEKIGRNDPCPCGSGKKYKKCCMN